MPIVPPEYEARLRRAVAHYWTTRLTQGTRQKAGDADRGARAAVTGGKQMDGFCELVSWLVQENGMPEASIHVRSSLEIPGFFRPTKMWDMLIVHGGRLAAAIEFKSQAGPSFGNNFNNRTEEALGNATDLWTAYREGAFGKNPPRPWLGWLMLLDDCEGSTKPVDFVEPHFKAFPEFRGASYARRYEVLLRKLLLEKLYDGAALLLASQAAGRRGQYREPADDLTMRRFLASLGAHLHVFLDGG